MQAPFICDFQSSNYTIVIVDATSPGLPPLTQEAIYTGKSRMIMETFESGLQANHHYNVTISVQDENFIGKVSTATRFSKFTG